MKNYLRSLRCARKLLKMTRQLVNREALDKLIAQTSEKILSFDKVKQSDTVHLPSNNTIQYPW